MAEYNLGTASGRIEVDGKAAAIGFKVAETAAGAFFAVIEAKVNQIQQTGRRLAAVGAAGVAGFGLAVKAASGFEKQMSGVQAVTGATGDEFDALRQKALDLGRDTVFSASESALAIEELAKAGIPVEDILKGAADATVALAAAGGIALPEAATIAANAMNQFGIASDKVVDVADVLSGVANTSAADVSSIGQSLSQVGAVANLAGLSFRDTAIAIGEMADAGINGSDAGTSLKTMLTNLIPMTDRQKDKFKELNLLTYDLANANKLLAKEGLKPAKTMDQVQETLAKYVEELDKGTVGTARNRREVDKLMQSAGALNNQFFDQKGNVKDLAGLQRTLGKALKDKTREEKLSTLETLFGADAMRATAILSLAGAKGYKEFSKAVDETSAAEVARIRLDNLSGAVESFKGSMETALITIGNIFLPGLTKIVQAATFVINIFNNLPHGIQVAIGIFAGLISIGLVVVGMFMAMLPVIAGMVANFFLMRSLGFVFTFFKTLVAACRAGTLSMATTQAAALATGNSFKTMGVRALAGSKLMIAAANLIARAWVIATGPIGIAIAIITGLVLLGILLYKKWTPFRELVDSIANILREKFLQAWAALQPIIQKTFDILKEFGQFVMDTLLPVLKSIGEALFGKILEGWDGIQKAINDDLMPAVDKLVAAWQDDVLPALEATSGFLAPIVGWFLKLAQAIGGFLLDAAMAIGKVFITFVLPILLKIAGFLGGVLIDSVVGFVKGIIQAISGVIQIFSGIINFFKGLFTGDWAQMWEGVKQIFSGIWDLIVGLLKAYIYVGMLKLVGLGFKLLFAIVKLGWRIILSLFKAAGKGILATIKGVWNLIVGIIKGVLNGVVRVVKGAWNLIVRIIKGAMKLALSILRGIWNFIVALIRGQLQRAIGIARSAWNTLVSLTKTAWNKFFDAIKTIWNKVITFIKEIPGKITDGIGDLAKTLYQKGVDLINGLLEGIRSKIGEVVGVIKDGLGKFGKFLPGSPIKAGPLVSWNRGGAGKRLMELLQKGIEDETHNTVRAASRMAEAMSRAFDKNVHLIRPELMPGAATITPLVAPGRPGGRRGRAAARQNAKMRLVEGTLRLDRSGKAYIRGIAEEVVDETNDTNDRYRRMSRR